MLKFKKNIEKLLRYQTSLNRDLVRGINLDRNEKVDLFSKEIQTKIKKNFSNYIFNATPDISSLYKNLSIYHKMSSKNFYITQGITECISHLIFSLVNKNEEVIFMSETYPMYDVWCKLHGIKYKRWNFENNFKLDFKELRKLISKKTKIIFLVNPNLPIEYEFSQKEIKNIYNLCKKNNTLLVLDEAYHYFGSASYIKKIKKFQNLVIMRTFSKAWGLPGIRLGYMAANKKICNYVSKCRSLVETNSFSYEIANWALKNPKILKDHVKEVKQGYNYLSKRFVDEKEIFYGGKKTNAILLKIGSQKQIENLKKFLRKKKIYVRSGFKKPIEKFIRISLCSKSKLSIFFNEFLKWKKKYNTQS